MDVATLAPAELAGRLRDPGLRLQTGPFIVQVRTTIPSVVEGIRLLWGGYPLDDGPFADFHVRLAPPGGLRRWFRPQVVFHCDDRIPFRPLPVDQAFPMLEWGLNWCIANYAHQYLVVHAAVVARDHQAMIMPAPPGAGKSTLCAGLIARGWRLLSDELTLIALADGQIHPLPRPVSLKNESIELMRRFAPHLAIASECRDTRKGTVAHLAIPPESLARSQEPARPAWIVFPRYQAGAGARLTPRPKGESLLKVAENGFNYSVLGDRAFQVLGDTIDRCACYDFAYSRLAEAIDLFNALEPQPAPETVAV